MGTIYSSKYYDVVSDEGSNALVFLWKPETEAMDDLGFREAVSNYAGYLLEQTMPNAVIDVRNFKPPMGVPTQESAGAWRAEVVVPRYNKAKLKKFAYLSAPEGMPVSPPTRHPGEEFETAVFDSEDQMRSWLSE